MNRIRPTPTRSFSVAHPKLIGDDFAGRKRRIRRIREEIIMSLRGSSSKLPHKKAKEKKRTARMIVLVNNGRE